MCNSSSDGQTGLHSATKAWRVLQIHTHTLRYFTRRLSDPLRQLVGAAFELLQGLLPLLFGG